MDKYAQLKMFHRDLQIQVYMYHLVYVDPETIPVEDYFTATKMCVENYNKLSTPVPIPKYCLGLVTYVQKIMSYIATLVK